MAEKITKSPEKTEENDVRKCKYCKEVFCNLSDYVDHLESKEHRKQLLKNKHSEKHLKTSKPELEEENVENSDSTDSSDSSEFSDDGPYSCKDCRTTCTGKKSYELHLMGKKHAKMAKKRKVLKQKIFTEKSDEKEMKITNEKTREETAPKDDDKILDSLFSNTKFKSSGCICKPCGKRFSGPENYQQHLQSNKHKNKLGMETVVKDMESFALTERGSNTKYYKCDICEKKMTNAEQYKMHLEGNAHLKKQQEVDRSSQLSEMSSKSEKLECKLCQRVFNRSIEVRPHMESISHIKKEKRIKQLEEVKRNYPEFNICYNEITGEFEFILCTVCNLPFTGPESATDHVLCPKHKRTAEEAKVKRKGKVSSAMKKRASNKDKQPNSDESDLENDFEVLS